MGNSMGSENAKTYEDLLRLPSRCDLLRSAQNHYAFIQQLNFLPHLFSPKVVKYAIFRYENYWLPFMAKYQGVVQAVAPIDIELIWVVHMLNVDAYKKDCLSIAKCVIPHYIPSPEERLTNETTQKCWQLMYPDNVVPLVIDHTKYPEYIKPYQSTVTVNLFEDVAKYRILCRQVSLPHYNDIKFLQTAVNQYLFEAIYYSKDNNRQQSIYTTFIWQTHAMIPAAYAIDLRSLTPNVLKKVRQDLKRLKDNDSRINQELNQEVPGGWFRGDVMPLVTKVDLNQLRSWANKSLTFNIMGFHLQNLDPNKNYRLKIRGKSSMAKTNGNMKVFRIHGGKDVITENFKEQSDDTTMLFNNAIYDILQIRVSEINMTNRHYDDTLSNKEIDEYDFDYEFFWCDEFTPKKQFKLEFSLPVAEGREDDLSHASWIRFECDHVKVGFVNLFFGVNADLKAMKADHPCKVLKHPELMAPLHVSRDTAPCIYVTKTLKDRFHETIFKCRLLKTCDGDFCSTEVFDFNRKLICSSYTIGSESLPQENQVHNPGACCIYRENVDTVFVIRSGNHEWGLLKVFHCAKPNIDDGANENMLVPIRLLFLNLKNSAKQWETLYDLSEEKNAILFKIDGGDMLVNLKTGTISTPPLLNEFPELLSLGLTVLSIFHVFPKIVC